MWEGVSSAPDWLKKKNSLLPVIGFVAFSHLLSAAMLARVPKQINFGHLGFPNQFCESLIFFLCKHFVLLQKTFMAARRVKWKHSTEHTSNAQLNQMNFSNNLHDRY